MYVETHDQQVAIGAEGFAHEPAGNRLTFVGHGLEVHPVAVPFEMAAQKGGVAAVMFRTGDANFDDAAFGQQRQSVAQRAGRLAAAIPSDEYAAADLNLSDLRGKGHRRPAVLSLVAGLLALAAGLNALGAPHGAVVAMGLAMGAENAVFEEDGEIRIGLTYMTGALVKVGQRLATALLGGNRFAWASYLWLWAGLVVGGITGAVIYPHLGLGALWFAAGAAAILAVAAAGMVRRTTTTAPAELEGQL